MRQEDNRKRQIVDEKEALCKQVDKKNLEMTDLNDRCKSLTEKIKGQDKQIEELNVKCKQDLERFQIKLKDSERHKDILTELDLIFQNYRSR